MEINYYVDQRSLNIAALLLSAICSRLNIAGLMILCCLLFIRLDFAVVSMARFYKKYPSIFHKNFPEALKQTRGMWNSAGKIVAEAEQREKDRVVEIEQREKDRLAETQRHKEILDFETEQREKDRIAETKWIAFDKMTSSDFEGLNKEQKEQ